MNLKLEVVNFVHQKAIFPVTRMTLRKICFEAHAAILVNILQQIFFKVLP